jgi:hypothetical protein
VLLTQNKGQRGKKELQKSNVFLLFLFFHVQLGVAMPEKNLRGLGQ